MEAEYEIQIDNYNNIVKAYNNFKKSPKARITEDYVEVRIESLECLWQEFITKHKSLIREYAEALKNHDYRKKDIYTQAEELYTDYKAELKTVLRSFKPKEKPNEPPKVKQCQVELPKISIPTFSGKYTEWVTFRDLFGSLIHTNQALDNVQKMHYLKTSLSGEAEQLLRQVPIAEANYVRCWELLKGRYDNKRYLAHFILKRFFSQKNITSESANCLKELLDTSKDCLSGLSNLGIDIKNWDLIVIYILTLKLDGESRKQWELNTTTDDSTDQLPTFSQFEEFLTKRYRALELISTGGKSYQSNFSNAKPVDKFKSLHIVKALCTLCAEGHKLTSCKKFLKENVDQRRQIVKTNQVCFNCLGNNHTAREWSSVIKCKLCKRKHHTLLHPRNTETPEATSARPEQAQEKESSNGTSAGPSKEAEGKTGQPPVVTYFSTGQVHKQVLLATALVNSVSKNGSNYTLRALLDQGSQASLVTESTVQNLKLKKIPIRNSIMGISGDKKVSNSMVDIKIKSRINPNEEIKVSAVVIESITTLLPATRVDILEWPELEKIELADPKYHMPGKIDILLGAEVYGKVIRDGVQRGPNGSVAQSTSLGWILSGVVDSSVSHADRVSFHCKLDIEDDQLKRFWELESDFVTTKEQMLTEEEKRCEEFFVNTTKRDEEGRYIVRLPFKNRDPDCKRGESRIIAEKRLNGLQNRLNKDEDLKRKYKEVLEEYLQSGHMIQVPEPDEKRKEAVYLPHHAVLREDKDTTKVRVVFDASASGKNGVSLNDELMVGPTIQPDIRNLVMRWRLSSICISADIVKMYRQVRVHEEDADFQRLLWRDDHGAETKDYKLLRVTFGTACAPFLAVRALQQVAYDEGTNYPLAAERVISDFYMDDLMTGCESVEEGIEIYRQIKELLRKGGFTLQKFTSNSDKLLEAEKGDQVNDKESDTVPEGIKIKTDKVIKVLGLTWERNQDKFRYAINLPELKSPVTKRKIIADISRLFDPLGWITPCIIVAKVIIQKLWIAGISWDEEVPENILKEWCTYRSELPTLTEVKIPRWVGTKSNDVRRELHGFCDASKKAYAAVVYIRIIDSQGQIHVSLVTAKSKVAPIKQVSIPRLELCGAVLLTRLMMDVSKVLGLQTSDLYAWTDSTIVLAWLNSMPNKWKVFVANRVSEILTTLNPRQWSHVSSKENPADCASRGIQPSVLKESKLWFNGPEFLTMQPIPYNRPKHLSTELEEVKVNVAVDSSSTDKIDMTLYERFSTLSRLVRVIAYCRRFLNLRKTLGRKEKTFLSYLTTEELGVSLECCIRQSQMKDFQEEIDMLINGKEVKKSSKMRSLNPFFDNRGIVRVGGRLGQSQLTEDRKHPILLSKESHLAKLIVGDAHMRTLHGGPQLTLNFLNQKYYILNAKQLVKAHFRKCVVCAKNAAVIKTQLMGQLPAVRVTPARPFSSSGVDFAGPIQIRTARGRGHKSYKGYVCLFVCMATRATHIEAVSDLTTQGFIQAFKRFVARRGHCQHIWSDNGTNFVGAAAELKKLFTSESSSLLKEISEALATNGTSWHFIPPHSPNFGGLWEAGIKSMKYHLKRVIGTSTLTFEEMITVLAQIEACLNSRPLSRLAGDTEGTNVLTPGHFLVGEPLIIPPDHSFEASNMSSLRRWQYTQKMVQDFWRKWSKEYLTQFLHRYKWSSQTMAPRVDDIVLVKEDGLPPCRWLYGRVVAEHPGPDNISRVFTIKTKNSIIKRSASKLCVLPITK